MHTGFLQIYFTLSVVTSAWRKPASVIMQHGRCGRGDKLNYTLHSTIGVDLLCGHNKSKCYKHTMWQFNQCDLNQLQHDLLKADFYKHYEARNPEMIFENWSLHLKELIASCIPNKEVTVRETDKPWFNGKMN